MAKTSSPKANQVDSSPRKKSPRLSKEDRKTAILAAARQVFEEVGYDKAKVSEIGKLVDVVEGTVFHYFGSKKNLVLKVMEDFYEGITHDVNEGIQGIQGTRNRLYFVIWFHFNTVKNNAALCGVILRESRGLDTEFYKTIQHLNRNYTNSLIKVIKEGIKSGEIQKTCSPNMVRNTVYGHIEHALWNLLSEGTKINAEDDADKLTNMIYHGIKTGNDTTNQSEVTTLIRKLNQLLD